MDIYEYEEEFIQDTPCKDGNYYLSAVIKNSEEEGQNNEQLIMDYRVDTQLFFKFSYSEVIEYAKTCPPNNYFSENLEIVQVVFKGELYTAVIKTYWLKVVQKAWKKYMIEKKTWLANVKKNIISILGNRGFLPMYPSYRGILC